MRNKPPPGKKLVSDWTGMRVVTRRDMKTQHQRLPAGSTVTVRRTTPKGFIIEREPCKCCGVSVYMTGIGSNSIEPAPDSASGGRQP